MECYPLVYTVISELAKLIKRDQQPLCGTSFLCFCQVSFDIKNEKEISEEERRMKWKFQGCIHKLLVHVVTGAIQTKWFSTLINVRLWGYLAELGLKNNSLVVLHNFFWEEAGGRNFFFPKSKSKLHGIIASISSNKGANKSTLPKNIFVRV